MKKVLMMVAVMMLVSMPVLADSTTDANYSVPSNPELEKYLNEQVDITHSHDLDEVAKFQNGVGVDLVVYSNNVVAVSNEIRHNLSTSTTTSFGVVKLNIFDIIKKALSK